MDLLISDKVCLPKCEAPEECNKATGICGCKPGFEGDTCEGKQSHIF